MRFGRTGGAGLEQNRQPIQYVVLPIGAVRQEPGDGLEPMKTPWE